MRFTHEVVNSDIMDLELIELKFIFDRSMCFICTSSCQAIYFSKIITTTETSKFSLITSLEAYRISMTKRCYLVEGKG